MRSGRTLQRRGGLPRAPQGETLARFVRGRGEMRVRFVRGRERRVRFVRGGGEMSVQFVPGPGGGGRDVRPVCTGGEGVCVLCKVAYRCGFAVQHERLRPVVAAVRAPARTQQQ